jgi:hypothetical protein
VTLPLSLRNRLAELVLDAFHDAAAREGLAALAAVCADPHALDARALPERFPAELFERGDGWRIRGAWKQHERELAGRAGRASRLLAGRPLDPADPPRATALRQAGLLFDAGLYFEVHELLEPFWMRAEGPERPALQGLIQVAVGFHHLAGGNVSGARTLLHDGCAKLGGARLEGMDLDPFARRVKGCLDRVLTLGAEAPRAFDWTLVPRFPVRE